MFEICPKCGNHEWNKQMSADKWLARCPKCGASWENRAFPLLILTGCSGVGKTTTARRLMERQQDFVVLDGDILFTDNQGEYMDWVERIEGLTRDIMQSGKPVVWTMAGNLDKLKKAWNERFFPGIYCLALVCEEAELRRRMTEGREISDAGWIRSSVEYNNYFLQHDRLDDIVFERLDVTILSPEQAAERVEVWIRSKLSILVSGKTAGAVKRREERVETRTVWMGENAGTFGTGLAGGKRENVGSGSPWMTGKREVAGLGFEGGEEKETSFGLGFAGKKNEKTASGLGFAGREEKKTGSGLGFAEREEKKTGLGLGFAGKEEKKTNSRLGFAEMENKTTDAGSLWMTKSAGVSGAEFTGKETKTTGYGSQWMAANAREPEAILQKETEKTTGSRWIWCYGDFELFHSLKLHARRDEFDHNFPPFWRLDDCRHNVRFKKDIELKNPEVITVHAYGVGNVEIDGKRHAFETSLYLTSGKHTLVVHVLNRDGLPCIYVEGETVASDKSWLVNCYGREWVHAGSSEAYADRMDNPQIFKFCYEKIEPVEKIQVNNGILYDFGRETFAKLRIDVQGGDADIFYGETKEEALDTGHSYLRAHIRAQMQVQLPGAAPDASVAPQPSQVTLQSQPQEISARAFRYLYLSAVSGEECKVQAYYEYLPLERRGSFCCSDETYNKIWDTAAYTFHLNSREFFLDGIKRDRWVWSGDAYQSYLINRYLFFDAEICKRTILALRGSDPVEKHINTIMDYSFYWLMSIYDYYEMTGDREFVGQIYPKMKSLMDFCMGRLDAEGFAVQVEDDWVFIDWAEMDKEGAVCAEQMLLAKSLEATAKCAQLAGENPVAYQAAFKELREKIDRFFWDEEKGAYIDSFVSGRRNVTRHANIFALLFGYVDEEKQARIIRKVLQNDDILQIRTPYFKFYELEALCRVGKLPEVTEKIYAYWGAMLSAGATSFWEEYTPKLPWEEQLSMYGDRYGKSLCHAWGASPVYLAGRYYLGVRPLTPGYRTFEVAPNPGGLAWFEGTVPVGKGNVKICFRDGVLEVLADVDGGILVWENKRYVLAKGVVKRIPSF